MATRAHADARENQKAMEKLHIFENKLYLAEQNREKELQKKLDTIRLHVGFICHSIFVVDFVVFFNVNLHPYKSTSSMLELHKALKVTIKISLIFHFPICEFQDRHAEEVRQKALSSKVEPNESIAVTCG